MKFNPEAYTIAVRLEDHDGETYFVGRVFEFPNISVFEDTAEEARSMVIDAIKTLKEMADEECVSFPSPQLVFDEEFSGRITLRLPKSLHAKIAKQAEQENVSLNTYLVDAISSYSGESDGVSKLLSGAISHLGSLFNAQQVAFSQVLNNFSVYSSHNQPPGISETRLISASLGYQYGQ